MERRIHMPLAAAMVVLAGLLGFGTTQAYFTYQKRLANHFRVGYNEITVTEEYDPPEEIVPGKVTEFRKAVQVQNTGAVPCYVRVRLEYSDSEMKQYCTHVLGEDSARAEDWETVVEALTDGAWVHGQDGCYYYRDPIKPEEETGLLLEQVRVEVPQDEAGKLKNFEIYVYAESIQTMVHVEADNGETAAREALDYEEAWTRFLDGPQEGV